MADDEKEQDDGIPSSDDLEASVDEDFESRAADEDAQLEDIPIYRGGGDMEIEGSTHDMPDTQPIQDDIDKDFEMRQGEQPAEEDFNLEAAGEALSADMRPGAGDSTPQAKATGSSSETRIVVDLNVVVSLSDDNLVGTLSEQLAEPIKEMQESIIREVEEMIQRETTLIDHLGLDE